MTPDREAGDGSSSQRLHSYCKNHSSKTKEMFHILALSFFLQGKKLALNWTTYKDKMNYNDIH